MIAKQRKMKATEVEEGHQHTSHVRSNTIQYKTLMSLTMSEAVNSEVSQIGRNDKREQNILTTMTGPPVQVAHQNS